MLSRIKISNYLFVPDQELYFEPGMTALTGETGAGKTILVGAISLIFADKGFAAEPWDGAKPVYLEADFELGDNQALQEKLEELEYNDAEQLTLARRVSENGRSSYFINGRKVTASLMQELRPLLIDFHHQRDQQRLLLPSFQLEVLDLYAGSTELRKEHASQLQKLRSMVRQLEEHKELKERNRQLEELYRFQLEELEAAAISAGEEQLLDKEHERISHLQQIRELGGRIGYEFYETEGSVMDVIRSALSSLDRLKGLDETIAQLYQALADAAQIISDCEGEVNSLTFMSDDDEVRLEQITQRLDQINSLLYKHRVRDTVELEQLFKEKRASILDFDSLDERIEELSKQIEADFSKLKDIQTVLSKKREAAADRLASELQIAIRSLAIANARFEISIDRKATDELLSSECLAAISLSGAESCEFRFSANPGTELAPLASVASGGELSRVLLAIKKVLAGRMEPLLMILDEIDAGLGGKTAEAVAAVIQELSFNHQVFCVTHLAVIAASADHHIAIEKQIQDLKTVIKMKPLNDSERTLELARMLSGKVTEASREHANQLLKTKLKE